MFEIRTQANQIFQHATRSVVLTPVPFFLVYTLFLRRTVWSWTFSFARSIFSNLPKHQKPSTFPPFLGDLILIYVAWAWVLVLVWTFANVAFDAYLAQPPLDKRKLPLSSGSKDPNGSLLTGLKSQREFVSNAAFAELTVIAHDDLTRRQTIFRELDRNGSSTWSQLVTVCIGHLYLPTERINNFIYSTPKIASATALEENKDVVNHLPRMVPPPRNDNVYAVRPNTKHSGLDVISSFAKSTGSYSESHPKDSSKRHPLGFLVDCILPSEQRKLLSQSRAADSLRRYFLDFVQLPYVGPPFRQTFARRAEAIVLGSTEQSGSNLLSLTNCARGLAKLAVCASTEDSWGKASKDVAKIIRTFSATISRVEEFMAGLEPHWTDVEFHEKAVPDVEKLIQVLKRNLNLMLDTYDGYEELGLTFKEKRVAREMAALGRHEAGTLSHAARDDSGIEMRERKQV
ncbi:MAG: hypothetical protein Q9162_001883 [Coniocarpon cinnabarinum]